MSKLSITQIRRVLKKYKPNIVHAHDFRASVITVLSNVNVSIISHIHNNPPWIKKPNIRSIAYAITSRRYAKILGVSEAIFKEYIFAPIIKAKSEVVSNPIDINTIIEKSKIAPYSKEVDILFLGRLTEEKDPLRFIRIISKVIEKNPKAKVVMVGDGGMRAECEEIINKYYLNQNIKLLGFMDNPYPILLKSKMLVIPSKWEGFGLVAIETFALGVPVISASVGGLVEIVNSHCGRLCYTDNDYIDEIIKIINDEKYQKNKSINALSRADELNNINDYTSLLTNIYSEVSIKKRFIN